MSNTHNFDIGSEDGRFKCQIGLDDEALQQVLRDRYNGEIKAGTTAGLFEALQQPPYNARPVFAYHYDSDGQLHDPDKDTPAIQVWHENGKLAAQEHSKYGQRHDPADGTAAVQEWHENGGLAVQTHWNNGQLNDPADGTAAIQRWHENGESASQIHCIDGKRHDPAPGLPARMQYSDKGEPVEAQFADGRIEGNPDELQELQKGFDALRQAQKLTQAFGDTGIQFTATPGPR